MGVLILPNIEVPGLGQVYADGFAEEATMQRILAAISSANNPNNPQAAADAAAGNRNIARSAAAADSQLKRLSTSSSAVSGQIGGLGNTAGSFSRRMDNATSTFERTMRTIGDSPFAITKVIGDGLSKAANGIAGALRGIPLVGDALAEAGKIGVGLAAFVGGQLLGEVEKMNTAFIESQKNGALLGGSMMNLRIASATAGLTMQQFNNVMAKASESMSMFGGGTTTGAREFARANQAFTNFFSTEMLRMGIGFEEMGIRTAETMGAMVLAGQSFNEFGYQTSDVANQTATLARQQKMLSAFNGTTIEQEKEKQRMARKDGQLNMAMAGMTMQQQEAVRQLTAEFPHLQQYIKETVAFGGPIGKEALMQQSMMGATTDAITNTLAQIESGADATGAMDALRRMRESSSAMADDMDRMRDVGILSIAGSNNSFVQIAARDYQTQLETTNKLTAGVFEMIQNDMGELGKETDNVTTAMVKMTEDMQGFSIALSGAVTSMIEAGGEFVTTLLTGPTSLARTIAESLSPGTSTGQFNQGRMDPAVQGEVITGPGGFNPSTSRTAEEMYPPASTETGTGPSSNLPPQLTPPSASPNLAPTATNDPAAIGILEKILREQQTANTTLKTIASQ